METKAFNTEKIIGVLLLTGALGVLIPYVLLTLNFDYPAVLRNDAGLILSKFKAGGAPLIWTWFAFAFLGLPLLEAIVLIGQRLEEKLYFVRWATTLGKIAILLQIVGLLRWVFVVPVLTHSYLHAGSPVAQEAAKITFTAFHQFGGVLLGEHLGQLLTIAWTVMISSAFQQLKLVPAWLVWLGYVASFIYLLAQAEVFATVMPAIPVWAPAGLIGSTLWLLWLIALGIVFIRKDGKQHKEFNANTHLIKY